MTTDYAEKLEAGLEFQDFVMRELHMRGIILQPICSKSEQLKGENMLGLEIKFDRRFRDTGNLYIETHEKSNPRNPNYVCSGILRDDNTWLYGIGDRGRFWIFTKKQLRNVYRRLTDSDRTIWNGVEIKQTPTSRGFIMPVTIASEWSAKTIEFSAEA